MRDALRKLQKDREARERDARQLARTAAREREADDDDDELERAQRALNAWVHCKVLSVDASECDLTKPSKKHERWPVVCDEADTTDPALVALQQHGSVAKILQAGRKAMRTLRKSASSVTHADYHEFYGKSVVGYVIGCKGDGTPGKCVAFQKSLNYLQDLDGNYAGTTKLRSGIMGTLGMEKCFAFPMALVNAEDRCLGEGGLYGAQVHSTGFELVGQCVMQGAPDGTWAPDVLKYVLADERHDLYAYAKAGVAPPLMAPKSREEMGALVKDGLANMSDDARERMKKGNKKGGLKSGVARPGKEHMSNSTEDFVLAKTKGFTYFAYVAEAHECIRDKRPPAPWAAETLTPEVLKRVAKAGLADGYFVTDLPEEQEKGQQRFYIEGYVTTRGTDERGHHGTDVRDYEIVTQRGPFDAHSVAVGLRLFGENERPPNLPCPRDAPRAVKALVARALAWSTDGADEPVTEWRPENPYTYFRKQKYAEVRAEVDADEAFADINGLARSQETFKRLGKMWKGLSKREKQRYKDDAPLLEYVIGETKRKSRALGATQPSPPPAKKPRAAPPRGAAPPRAAPPRRSLRLAPAPRRSTRLAK
jgi:hypothetical protein